MPLPAVLQTPPGRSRPPGPQPPVATFRGPCRHGGDVLRRGSAPQQGGAPSGLTGTVRSARQNVRRGPHAARCEGVTYNAQLWPNQLGKPIEGDLRVDVDETELEFLGLDEQLPTGEFGGFDDAEEYLEDYILRFARSLDHKGISPCGVRGVFALRKERRAQQGGILEVPRWNTPGGGLAVQGDLGAVWAQRARSPRCPEGGSGEGAFSPGRPGGGVARAPWGRVGYPRAPKSKQLRGGAPHIQHVRGWCVAVLLPE